MNRTPSPRLFAPIKCPGSWRCLGILYLSRELPVNNHESLFDDEVFNKRWLERNVFLLDNYLFEFSIEGKCVGFANLSGAEIERIELKDYENLNTDYSSHVGLTLTTSDSTSPSHASKRRISDLTNKSICLSITVFSNTNTSKCPRHRFYITTPENLQLERTNDIFSSIGESEKMSVKSSNPDMHCMFSLDSSEDNNT